MYKEWSFSPLWVSGSDTGALSSRFGLYATKTLNNRCWWGWSWKGDSPIDVVFSGGLDAPDLGQVSLTTHIV